VDVKLLGLEINDAGIICALQGGQFLTTDKDAQASPGFALVQDRELMLGIAAHHQAYLQPRQTNCRFWDELNDAPLRNPEFERYTHAELAYRHLKHAWQNIAAQAGAAEVIITVPDHYQDDELGLLLGIAATLTIPVRGLISQALACTSPDRCAGVDVHVDVHLHRLAVTLIDNRPRPAVCRYAPVMKAGLETIHREWVNILSDAFVRQTRFDPLYAAESEQALHDRLPGLASQEGAPATIQTEMTADGRIHRIELDREALMVPYAPWIESLRERIDAWQAELAVPPEDARLLVTQRAAALPGFVRQLATATGLAAQRLPSGQAAINALTYREHFKGGPMAHGVPFLNRVPRTRAAVSTSAPQAAETPTSALPTHLVYRGWAYPITAQRLVVGREPGDGTRSVRIRGHLAGISRRHFSVARENQQVRLTDASRYGTRVDEIPVAGNAVLKVGQTIRIGEPGEILQVIACLPHDETPIT
jgi:hypothetical protein